MNYIEAVVTKIESVESINLVHFEAQGEPLVMMALELDRSLCKGSNVLLGAKATNIAIATSKNEEISISNQLQVIIESVNNGEILSSIKLRLKETIIESIITRASSVRMGLKEENAAVALIKASELSIVEIR